MVAGMSIMGCSHLSKASKDSLTGGIQTSLSARERLNVNLSTTCVELAISTANMISQESEQVLRKPRGSYAPYQIRNRTGLSIYIWSDADGSAKATDIARTEVANEKTIDWRFDDWKTMRDVRYSALVCKDRLSL